MQESMHSFLWYSFYVPWHALIDVTGLDALAIYYTAAAQDICWGSEFSIISRNVFAIVKMKHAAAVAAVQGQFQ